MSDGLDPDLVIEVAEDYALSLPEAAEVVRATLDATKPPPEIRRGQVMTDCVNYGFSP